MGDPMANPEEPRRPEPDPEPEWPSVPQPPPPPPIPDLLTRPVPRPASMDRPKGPRTPGLIEAASGYAAAISFIATVLGFGALGWLVDRYGGTGPWGVLLGLGLGLFGATVRLLRDMNRPAR